MRRRAIRPFGNFMFVSIKFYFIIFLFVQTGGGRGVCCRGAWQRQWHVGAIEFMLPSHSHIHSLSLTHSHNAHHAHVELANKTCCSLGLLPEFKLIEFMFDCVLNFNASHTPLCRFPCHSAAPLPVLNLSACTHKMLKGIHCKTT